MSDQGEGLIWAQDEDGDHVAFDPQTGLPVGGLYADGRGEFDVAGYEHPEFAAAGYYDAQAAYDPRGDELNARLDEINAQMEAMNERSRDQLYVPNPRSEEALGLDMTNQARYLEGMLGRRLTDRERHDIASRAVQNVEAGDDRPDLLYAAAQLGDEGRAALHDLDTHDGRVEYGVERLADLSRVEGEVYSPQAQPSREGYDLDRHEDRVAYAADRLAGADVEDLSFRSSDLEGME